MSVSTKRLTVIKTFSYYDQEHELTVKDAEEASILDTINAHNIAINQSCGGHGVCTTCKIKVLEGSENLSAKTDYENEVYQERHFDEDERLACQCSVEGAAVKVRIVYST